MNAALSRALSRCLPAAMPEITDGQRRFNRLVWWLLLPMSVADILWMLATGLRFDPQSYAQDLAYIGLCGLVGWYYRFLRGDYYIWMLTQIVQQILCLKIVGFIFTYVTSTANFPYAEEAMARADGWLGFDWAGYVHWVEARGWLLWGLNDCYASLDAQLGLMLAALFLSGRLWRLQQVVFASAVALVVATLCAMCLPVQNAYVHYAFPPDAHHLLVGLMHRLHAHESMILEALRHHTFDLLKNDKDPGGLINFPSYHTVMGLLFLYAFWPLRWLRFLAIMLNLGLILSTPVIGGHYIVDVVAGGLVGMASLMLARRLLPRPGAAGRLHSAAENRPNPAAEATAGS